MLALGGCIATTYPYIRTETAQRIAAPAWMVKRDIGASSYILRAYERIHKRGGNAHIYIEDDGASDNAIGQLSNDPTPENPVALHLASKDSAENVIYIARPCQYVSTKSNTNCDKSVWQEKRYAPAVIESFEAALDDITRHYNIRGFHLVGYDGGGAVATLLATVRSDILSIRTVAGILDHEAYTTLHNTEPLDGSLNPASKAHKLAKIPQYHFVGGQDDMVPPTIIHGYLQNIPPTNCIHSMLVQEAEHDTGWVDKWPELLKLPVTCHGKSKVPDFGEKTLPIEHNPLPFNMTTKKSEKP